MSKRVLGFDVSSTTIGYCVLDVDEISGQITFVTADYLNPLKKGGIIDRIADTRRKIRDIIETHKPDCIGIEDIIQFMKGKSTAKTIIMLTTFNRMTGLCAYDYLQKSPELFSVMTIRHGLKTNKDLPKKEDMPELVANHLGIAFPYITSRKKNGDIKIKTESYDMADGVAVALYYAFVLTGKVKRPKAKKK